MIVSVRLKNFRTYRDASFEFSPGVTIVVGPNASGKTNLLESLMVLCTGSSFRAKDNALITYAADWARLEGLVDDERRSVVVKKEAEEKITKQFVINTQKYLRLSPPKKKSVVVFEPQHLQLFQAGPDKRREYLDDVLERIKPGYGKVRRDYIRTLAQRNKLLKNTPNPPDAELFAWNVRISELGGVIANARADLVSVFNKRAPELYKKISSTDNALQLEYVPDVTLENYTSKLLHVLERTKYKDIERGFTGHGPHREDFVALLNAHDSKTTASRGESRTILLVLKLLEIGAVEERDHKKPVLLLDDVFSELDGARRKALTRHLKGYQTFITTTDADVVVHHFIGECTIIPTEK